MGKITLEFETEYNVGDAVVFEKNGCLLVGIVEGYYVEDSVVWYNIRVSRNYVYTYTNGGDIGEFSIIGKIENCVEPGDDSLKEKVLNKISTL